VVFVSVRVSFVAVTCRPFVSKMTAIIFPVLPFRGFRLLFDRVLHLSAKYTVEFARYENVKPNLKSQLSLLNGDTSAPSSSGLSKFSLFLAQSSIMHVTLKSLIFVTNYILTIKTQTLPQLVIAQLSFATNLTMTNRKFPTGGRIEPPLSC
jgi:hypothetical protein